MTAVPAATVVEQLNWRRSVKTFDPTRTLSTTDWSALEQALVLSPSSYGLQPWRFVVVTDKAVKEKLPAISWNQNQPRDCSHMVVFAARRGMNSGDIDRHIERTAEVRGVPKESLEGFRQMMLGMFAMPGFDANAWTDRQVYIALGELMVAAALMGIDACPMEGVVGPKYDELLNLGGSGYATIVGCAVGYRAADDRYSQMPKVRFPLDEMVIRV